MSFIRYEEAVFHTFFLCKRANKKLWDLVFPHIWVLASSHSSVRGILLILAESLSREELELMVVLSWAIWSDQNSFNHGRPLCSPASRLSGFRSGCLSVR